MSTNFTKVFDGIINTNTIAVTNVFKNVTGIYIVNKAGNGEIAIDAHLQIKLDNNYRVIPLYEQEINTEAAYTFPLEYKNSDLEMLLLFTVSTSVSIQAYVYDSDDPNQQLLEQINTKLDSVEQSCLTGNDEIETIFYDFLLPIAVGIITGNPIPILPPALRLLLPGS